MQIPEIAGLFVEGVGASIFIPSVEDPFRMSGKEGAGNSCCVASVEDAFEVSAEDDGIKALREPSLSFSRVISSQNHTLRRNINHLAAFHTSSPLFFSSSQVKIHSKKNKPRIFLPHLVASLEQVDQTYIMIKPDGVQRGLVGEIISRFEKKGFKLTGIKLFQCPKELAEEHYKDLSSKPFFPSLIEYITSGPVVCMAWEGVGVVPSARKLIGATNPLQAEPGTIRGDLAVQTGRNVVHGSDSPENGKREIGLWFNEGEVIEWTPAQSPWLRE